VGFFRREKCEKLSAFALPQKLVLSVVMVTRLVYEKVAQTIFCQNKT
jgi:hypothetical protein